MGDIEIKPFVPTQLNEKTKQALKAPRFKQSDIDELNNAMPRSDQSDRDHDAALKKQKIEPQEKPVHSVVRFFRAIGRFFSGLFGR